MFSCDKAAQAKGNMKIYNKWENWNRVNADQKELIEKEDVNSAESPI